MLSSYKVGTAADAVRFYLNGSNIKRCKRKLGFFLTFSLSTNHFCCFFANLGNGLQTDPDNAVSSNVDQNNDNVEQFRTVCALWSISKLWDLNAHYDIWNLTSDTLPIMQRKLLKTKIYKYFSEVLQIPKIPLGQCFLKRHWTIKLNLIVNPK